MNKREFIRNFGLLSTSVAIAPSFGFKNLQNIPNSGFEVNHEGEQKPVPITLRDKFLGCIAGSWIGSAMGAVVEGWPQEKVKATYGTLNQLLPYKHYIEYVDWQSPAGATEDGIERQKLISTAIIEKKDRILAQDLATVWVRDLDPDKMVYKQEPFDRSLLLLIKAGLPGVELGRLSPFLNVISVARSSHPLGLINAGDPQGAADDSFEVGKLYLPETAFALRWAALYNAGIAEACKPNATVTSVINTVKRFASYRAETGGLYTGVKVEKFAYDTIEKEVNRAFELAEKYNDPEQLREEFNKIFFGGFYLTYGVATANEIVAKGLAIFALHKGDPREAIITAVNFGRDTDCLAAIAGGLSGALSGTSKIPKEWMDQVNIATVQDPYTNNKRSMDETAEGLFQAYLARRMKTKEYLDSMGDEAFLKSSRK